MTGYFLLLVAHVVLTTAGYAGLIATNVVVLIFCLRAQPALIPEAVSVWLGSHRVFGPMLGVGILLGLWLTGVMHLSYASRWLLVTYGLIVVAMVVQGAILIPWQRRAAAAGAQGIVVSPRPLACILAVFAIIYIWIVSLMLVRPG